MSASFFLPFSLLLALLVSPCFLLVAYWYKSQLPRTVMTWRKPEMVIITITFLIASLILFIVGVSSFFRVLDVEGLNLPTSHSDITNLKHICYACGLLLVAAGFTYTAIRMLLVKVVTDQGIVRNARLLRIPDVRNIIYWETITDYYLVSDYPNVIFTLIIRSGHNEFERTSVRVPVYMREEFEDLLESRLFSSGSSTKSDVRSQPFSGN